MLFKVPNNNWFCYRQHLYKGQSRRIYIVPNVSSIFHCSCENGVHKFLGMREDSFLAHHIWGPLSSLYNPDETLAVK